MQYGPNMNINVADMLYPVKIYTYYILCYIVLYYYIK